jgi:hypothetical protein
MKNMPCASGYETMRMKFTITFQKGKSGITKKTSLTALDIAHEKLRMQIFLAYELNDLPKSHKKRLICQAM